MFDKLIRFHLKDLPGTVDDIISPERYRILRRKIVVLMAVVTLLPLALMSVINYQQYQASLSKEIQNPLRVLLNKSRNSFELFLAERTSTVSFIASAYSFGELSDERNLTRIFNVMRQEFEGFVDLGLIDANGFQVSYSGPYNLKGKDYSEQAWFHQTRVRGRYLSDVFMGFRKFPHIIIAVQHTTDSGESWILRATIDTRQFDRLIAAMSLEPGGDAFLLNRSGVLQTDSVYYGKALEQLPMDMPQVSYEPNVFTTNDPYGRDVFLGYTYFPDSDFVLMAVKPRASILKTWYTLRMDLVLIFAASVALIFIVVYRMTGLLLQRMQESEERRDLALQQVEHTQRLSSIGRLAAGVAHEVNNPLAIINEKAGLMKDLFGMKPEYPDRERFLSQIDAILRSVDRCRGITHRMLGFAKRMEVKIEVLDVNGVLKETIEFLEKEASYRNVSIVLSLGENLPHIASDRGQLQQVFLNILNNALAAVPDGGQLSITTWEKDLDTVGVTIQDNGVGMSEETLKHIFEPFFTTKKGSGTGLGLSITYGIVRRLGGEIVVQSKPGEGSTFTVYLPKKAPEGVREGVR